tara:strand:- start:194 stop:685 length:492 start_codon:yes stop_codon:yes gene_type:complete
MADTKVSDLTQITVAGNNDILYIVNETAGTSNKITFQNLLGGVNSNITTLTNDVNTYTTTVLELSAEFVTANLDLGPLQSDFLELSGDVDTLSAEIEEFELSRSVFSSDIDTLCANIDFLSGSTDTLSAEFVTDRDQTSVTGSFVIETSTFEFLKGRLVTVTP